MKKKVQELKAKGYRNETIALLLEIPLAYVIDYLKTEERFEIYESKINHLELEEL